MTNLKTRTFSFNQVTSTLTLPSKVSDHVKIQRKSSNTEVSDNKGTLTCREVRHMWRCDARRKLAAPRLQGLRAV